MTERHTRVICDSRTVVLKIKGKDSSVYLAVFIDLGKSGYEPESAKNVFKNRYGECDPSGIFSF